MSVRGKGASKLLMVGVGVVVEVGWSVDVAAAGEVDGVVEDSGGVERVISPAHPDRSETQRITISMTIESVL
jgi:hypothetical protein